MITAGPMDSNRSCPASRWSNRILLLALAGILFLTLYPFHFDFSVHLARPLFPFSLGGSGKHIGPLDDFLNVLLFVPFGFGLSNKLRERGVSRMPALAATLAAGIFLSYTIEFLQIYIPQRDSGWEDVLTNSIGAVLGAMVCDLLGGVVLPLLSASERGLSSWLRPKRACLILLLYFGFWCVLGVVLQKQINLRDWNPDSVLVVGNTVENHYSRAWKGRILSLEIWDYAMHADFAERRTSSGSRGASDSGSIVAYEFSGSALYRDDHHLLPDLSWVPHDLFSGDLNGASLDGGSWLVSQNSVSPLVDDLKNTGQFALRVACEPADTTRIDARIVSISSPAGTTNLELRQKNDSLIIWFRTPLTLDRGRMSWVVPNAFLANEPRNILFSFNGADADVFLDGKKQGGTYEMGPGLALARFIHHVKAQELKGYEYVFYSIVFFPAGCILGLTSRRTTRGWVTRTALELLGVIIPALILEAALVHASGRAISFANVALSVLLAVGGSLWINADRIDWKHTKIATN